MVGIVMNARIRVKDKQEFSSLNKLLSSANEKINIEEAVRGKDSKGISINRDIAKAQGWKNQTQSLQGPH